MGSAILSSELTNRLLPTRVLSWVSETHLQDGIVRNEYDQVNLPWYPNGTPCIVLIFGWGGAILVLVTFVIAALAWSSPVCYRPWLFLLAAFWAISPSLWFWYEYHYLIVNRVSSEQLEKYKYGVQLGTAIWAGVAVALAAYLSSDQFKLAEGSSKSAEEIQAIAPKGPSQ